MFFRTVYKSGQIFLPFCQGLRLCRTDRRTDGQTDGQTDRILIAIPRLHYMQRGKNPGYGPDDRNKNRYLIIKLYFYPYARLLFLDVILCANRYQTNYQRASLHCNEFRNYTVSQKISPFLFL